MSGRAYNFADAGGEGTAVQLRRAQRRPGLSTGRPSALAIVEMARSYEMPAIPAVPDGSDIAVELYGGAGTLRLDGENHRGYVRRFHYAGFDSQEEARQAFDRECLNKSVVFSRVVNIIRARKDFAHAVPSGMSKCFSADQPLAGSAD